MFINNKEFSLKVPREAKEYLQFLVISKYDIFPFFTNLLLNLSDIEDVHPERKEDSLAYTYFDHQFERIKIRINYDMIENGMKSANGALIKFTNENVLFLIYHELIHNFFHHFTRHSKYFKEYAKLSNIVEDAYCNEFLFRLFSKEGKGICPENLGAIDFEELKKMALLHCKEPLPFTTYEEKPLEEVLIEFFIKHKNNWESPSSQSKGGNKGNKGNGGGESGGQPQNPSEGSGESSSNSLEGDGLKGNVDNHKAGQQYSEESLNNLNKERKSAGKSEISETEAANLASKKIDNAAIEAAQMAGDGISQGERDFLRFKEKIMKKDPFLNFVVIKNTLKKMASRDYYKTYSKPNRKKHHFNDIVYKGRTKETGLHIVVGVDVSGSVSDKELKKIYEMLSHFMEKNSREVSIDIFYWSSCKIERDIHFHKNISSMKELLALKVHSSGGTILETVHDFLSEQYKGKTIDFLNITDGWFSTCPMPECVGQYYFCLTENGHAETLANAFPKAKIKVCKIIP